jgi:sugar/nucleoside kinase (ribokinase family)
LEQKTLFKHTSRPERPILQILFIGQAYIDVTLLADHLPQGDEKAVAKDYAISFGGNAVTAAFACAKLGIRPDLMTNTSLDWLGRMFGDMAAQYGIQLHNRPVKRSSLSFIMPRDGKRAILRAREDEYLHPFPILNLEGCKALHLDGHQPDAALNYAKACRERSILTSLDGGGLRSNTDDLLHFIDVAVVAERLCEQMKLAPADMLDYLKHKGCKVGGVTLGSQGMLWYDEKGIVCHQAALPVALDKIIDTNGAGDIFHGAYMYSYLCRPNELFKEHFRFARAASAHSIQHLGNEASLPSIADIEKLLILHG